MTFSPLEKLELNPWQLAYGDRVRINRNKSGFITMCGYKWCRVAEGDQMPPWEPGQRDKPFLLTDLRPWEAATEQLDPSRRQTTLF